MLALAARVNDDLVQLLGAVAAGDDDGQSQLLAQRFEGVGAEPPQVLHHLGRRPVVDAVLHSRDALGELPQLKVRCQNSVVFHKRYLLKGETIGDLLVKAKGLLVQRSMIKDQCAAVTWNLEP